MPDDFPETASNDRRKMIDDELKRLEESAMFSAQVQFEAAKQWHGANLALGIPAIVLAAISGAATLATVTGRTVAGVLALISAAFGGILTTINAAHRASQATVAANTYLELQTAARQARLIDIQHQTIDEARATLTELTARRNEQNKSTEPPSRRAYRKGAKNIAAGGQTYDVDKATDGSR